MHGSRWRSERERTRISIVSGIAVALFACIGICAGAATPDELAKQLAKLFPPGTATDEQTIRVSQFQIRAVKYRELSKDLKLTDVEHAVARISVDQLPSLAVDIDRGRKTIGIEVVDTQTQASLVSVGKHDSEGRLNSLRYTAVDDMGELDVFDYEMDGQADLRVHYAPSGYSEIWHANRWFRIERKQSGSWIHVDGHFKRVSSKDGRLYVESP